MSERKMTIEGKRYSIRIGRCFTKIVPLEDETMKSIVVSHWKFLADTKEEEQRLFQASEDRNYRFSIQPSDIHHFMRRDVLKLPVRQRSTLCGSNLGGGRTCTNPQTDPHPCPYSSEIHSDNTPCRCCDDCERNCSYEV